MARITIDDCLKRMHNRYSLTLAATQRARQIANGATALVDQGRHKPTVLALKELAQGKLAEEIVNRYRE